MSKLNSALAREPFSSKPTQILLLFGGGGTEQSMLKNKELNK